MAVCKFCALAFDWGQKDDGRWVPLVPVSEHGNLDRSFQDDRGQLRAEHALVCVRRGGPTVRVVRLARIVSARDIMPSTTDPDSGEIRYYDNRE